MYQNIYNYIPSNICIVYADRYSESFSYVMTYHLTLI